MEHKSFWISNSRSTRILILSIFLLLLIHVAGGIGMIYFDTSFFAKTTPINLLLMFTLILLNQEELNKGFYIGILITFLIGLGTEIIGVNTGLIFGIYTYGDILGFKLIRVPLLISLNWFSVVYSSFVTASCIMRFLGYSTLQSPIIKSKTLIVHLLLAACLATFFDWIMEPVAVKLGFWAWDSNVIPLYNYVSWFVISFFISFMFFVFRLSYQNRFAPFLMIVQCIFFLFLRIFLK